MKIFPVLLIVLLVCSQGEAGAQSAANTVLAGPSSGSAAAATYRSLVSADLPSPFIVPGNAQINGNLTLGSSPTLSSASGALLIDSGSTQLASFSTSETAFGDGTHNSLEIVAPGANAFVNNLKISGSITGNAPYAFFTGSDANIGGIFYTKGTGQYNFVTRGDSTQVSQFRILDNSSGADYITVTSGASNAVLATNAGGLVIQPSNGQVTTNGSLTLGASPTLATTSGTLLLDLGATQSASFSAAEVAFGDGTHNSLEITAPGANAYVNNIKVSGAITGNAPYLFFTGSDSNIGGQFYLKGTGTYNFTTRGDSTQVSQFRILDNSSGANYIRVTSGATNALMDTNAGGLTIQPNSGVINIPALSASSPVYTDANKNLTSTAPAGYSAVLSGTSASLGGSALLAGACTAGTVTVTGARSTMVATASPSADPDSTLSTGIAIYAFVSSNDTVTVRICAIVAVTPAATTYNVRVLQ